MILAEEVVLRRTCNHSIDEVGCIHFNADLLALVYQEIPGIINTETVLSYLGIGLPSTYPSLGRMIDVYWSFVDTYPHMILFPGIVMGLITISFYIVGQLFADASDPRTHR